MANDETITYLEMTSPDQLRPSVHRSGMDFQLKAATPRSARRTYERIFEPLGHGRRLIWTDTEWADELSLPGVQAWIAQIARRVAGLVELEASGGDIGIVVFGLIPERIGQGWGGQLLTLVTRMAWELASPDGHATKRVWLQTSSRDHVNALPNYEDRGFRPFRKERMGREITKHDR